MTLTILLAATLLWQPVTKDITGAPETVSVYRVYSRKAATTESFVKITETPLTSIVLPTPAAKQEYAVSAVDLAGNEGDKSIPVTAKPETPQGPQVVR